MAYRMFSRKVKKLHPTRTDVSILSKIQLTFIQVNLFQQSLGCFILRWQKKILMMPKTLILHWLQQH